jgi:cytochrome c oxidase cbb3-type subunit 3
MSDFVSGFWPVYGGVRTALSLAGCAWLLVVTGRARAPAADTAASGGRVPPRASDAATSDAPPTTGHVWDDDLTEYNNPLPGWWRNLFWITMIFGVVYLLLYPGFGSLKGALGWSSASAYAIERRQVDERTRPMFEQYLKTDLVALSADPQARAAGERLFLNYCAVCHGSSATGSRGFPNLADNHWLYGGDPKVIETSILEGRMGVMPALGPALGDEGVRDVVDYVRSLSRLTHDSLKAQLGKPLFLQNCAACHGADGKGNVAVGAPDLTDDDWLYGSSQATITETVTKGRHTDVTPGTLAMPAWKDVLGEARVHVLAAYVWGLSKPSAQGAAGVRR